MKKITLYIGLNDQNTKTQKIDTTEAIKIVENIAVKMIGGCTIYNAIGVYTHDDGTIITENTLRVELFDCNDAALKKLISTIKTVLNQESIIEQIEDVNSIFC